MLHYLPFLSTYQSSLQVCVTKPCRDTQFVTCGLTCAEKLVTSGPHDKSKCDVRSFVLNCIIPQSSHRPFSIATVAQRLRERINAVRLALKRRSWPAYFVRLALSSIDTTSVGGHANRLLQSQHRSFLRRQKGTLHTNKVLAFDFILNCSLVLTVSNLVEKKFLSAWQYPGTSIPPIKKVYKIIENKSFLQPYDAYK
jgi:hypothetical protein